MPFKIAIVGAGPSGTLLARLILNASQQLSLPPEERISVTVFETECRADFRSQGGTLDLHVMTGQMALKAAGLWDEFKKHARYDGQNLKLLDKNGLCYVRVSGSDERSSTARPEIDRPLLREMLYRSLPEGTVRWDHKLTSVSTEAGTRTLTFANGKTQSGVDLVVGADGAFSKVRPLVTDAKPFYSGIGGHIMRIPDSQKNAPELYQMVNRGNFMAWSHGQSLMAQYLGDGTLMVSTWSLRPADWQSTCGYDVHDPKAVKRASLAEYHDWDPSLRSLLEKVEDHAVARDLYMLPIGNHWTHVRGVTLVGDAAHLMTPFAGEGVNLALEDSWKLGQAILAAAAASTSPPRVDQASTEKSEQHGLRLLDQQVQKFEEDMFVRAKATQQLTYKMMHAMYLTPDSPRHGIERYLLLAIEDVFGFVGTKLVMTPLVYLWFFVFRMIW